VSSWGIVGDYTLGGHLGRPGFRGPEGSTDLKVREATLLFENRPRHPHESTNDDCRRYAGHQNQGGDIYPMRLVANSANQE
jgi:hypothetical protein